MTIEQPVVLDVGPKEFELGLTYTGSSRTTDFRNLALDPLPSFNRILKIFTMTRFREKEAEIKRRETTRAAVIETEAESQIDNQENASQPGQMEVDELDEEDLVLSQLSNISL